MILTSITASVPFTPSWLCVDGEPKPGAPVYHLRAGGVVERGQLEAELAGPYRAGRVYGFELRIAIRSGVVALLAEDPEFERVLGLIDAEADAEAGGQAMSDEDGQLFAQIRNILAESWPEYRDLVAQAERRRELAPILAFRRFCMGWDNVAAPFAVGRDRCVTEAALRGVDPLDMLAAGNRAYSLLYADDQAGNSERPGSSAKDPQTSPSADTSTAGGSSKARSGRKTRG